MARSLQPEQSPTFTGLKNPYVLLDIEGEKAPKKPQMADASTQTSREISVQTDSSDAVSIVAHKTLEEGAQISEKLASTSSKYPLKHVDFQVIEVTDENIDKLDENLPEIAPYVDKAGEAFIHNQKHRQSIFGKMLGGISNGLYWTAASTANYIRTGFYRTENEVLRDMVDPAQEIRVSSSWFFGGDREVLYGLSHNSTLQTRFLNVPKWLYYEGVTSIFSSEKSNTLKLFQVFPYVMKDRINHINDKISTSVEALARKAITVLTDDQYDNLDFLEELESDLRFELDNHLKLTSEFIIHKMGEVKTGMKKVQAAMHAQIERDFPEGGGYIDRYRNHIDTLKVYSDRFFKMGDAVAQETIEGHQRVIDESAKFYTDSIEDRKGRIHVLAKELLELRADTQAHNTHFARTLKEFEKILNS